MERRARRSADRIAPSSGADRGRRRLAACCGLLAALLAAPAATAGPSDALVLPPALEIAPGEYVTPAQGSARIQALAAELDTTVQEAVIDLGLALRPLPEGSPPSDRSLPALSPGDWVFAPRLRVQEEVVVVRLLAVAPGSRVELSREETFAERELANVDVRTVVMLRDVFEAGTRTRPAPGPEQRPVVPEPATEPESSGRSVLALNAAVLGGYVGFTIQKASGSADSRLLYPLVALGSGLGLGASLLIADEWNIGQGDAWYLTAAAWWPAAAGILLAQSYGEPPERRYAYGLAAASSGIALGALAIGLHPLSEGGAVLTHSSAAYGALLGAMAQIAYEGKTGGSVTRGIGWGAGAGVLLGGVVATQVDASPSRVLLVDLSASLGGLAGAALASPLLLVEETHPTRTRLWLASAGAGTIAGALIGWYATSSDDRRATLPFVPYAGLSPRDDETRFDLGVSGHW